MPQPKKNRKPCRNCGQPCQRPVAIYCSRTCQLQFQRKEKIKRGKGGSKLYRNHLLETRGHQCSICGIMEWRGQPTPLVMDHVDGNPENNDLKNLRMICPNCDAQLPTYKGKNKGNGRHSRRMRYKDGKSF